MATITLDTVEPPDTLRALAAMLEHLATLKEAVRGSAPTASDAAMARYKEWVEKQPAAGVYYEAPQPAPASVVPPPPATAASETDAEYSNRVNTALEDAQAATISVPPPSCLGPPSVPGQWDAQGYPWDERIHSSSRALLADGSWRQRRNLPSGVREQVEAELRAAGRVGPAAHAAASVPPPPLAPVVPPPPPPAPLAGDVLPPPPPAPAHTLGTFMPVVTRAMTEGRLTVAQIMEACQAAGLPLGLNSLGERPEAIPAVAAALGLTL